MIWTGPVVCVQKKRNAYKVWQGNVQERDHFEELGVDGQITLMWIIGKWDEKIWTVFCGAQDEDKWQAALKKALNLHVLRNTGNFVTS